MEKDLKKENMFQERQTAIKLPICDLLSGTYVKTPQEFQPNYILTKKGEHISRANLLGVVLSVDAVHSHGSGFVLDDGTGKITARVFETMESIALLQVGTLIQVIGKPRSFQDSVYLIPEVITCITDPRLINMRKLEWKLRDRIPDRELKTELKNAPLKNIKNTTPPSFSSSSENQIIEEVVGESEEETKNSFETVMDFIKKHDSGDGADIEQVISSFEGDGEKLIKILLEEGEIFEIKPGKVKVLE